jgi:hypothetical protein
VGGLLIVLSYLLKFSHDSQILNSTMTLDVLSFIESKGGNPNEIRDSQRKRGESQEIVDEIIQMYSDWVKSTFYATILMAIVMS